MGDRVRSGLWWEWEWVGVWVPGLSGVGVTLTLGICMRARAIRIDQVEIQIARLRIERPPWGGKSPHIREHAPQASPASVPTISAPIVRRPAEQLGDAAREIKIELGTTFALDSFTATKVPPGRARGKGGRGSEVD